MAAQKRRKGESPDPCWEGSRAARFTRRRLGRDREMCIRDRFYPEPGARSTMRLNFTNADEELSLIHI